MESPVMRLGVRLCALLAFALASFVAAPASAKGPIDKLTIEGPGLSGPIEITDSADMSRFHPGPRYFISWDLGIAPPPPLTARTYAVSFYMESQKIYELEYTPDPSGGPGYIYIPGPGHPAYQRNIQFLLTNSTDPWDPNGKVVFATAEWDAMIEHALQAQSAASLAAPTGQYASAASVPDGPDASETLGQAQVPTVPGPPLWAISAAVIGVITGLASTVWRNRRHRKG